MITKEKLLKDIEGKMQYRSFSFSLNKEENKTRGVFDTEKRLVEFSLSSEVPYERWFGMEILGHKPDEVDMSRILNGAPFLLEHDQTKLIGKVESARIENGRIICVARFGRSKLAQEIFDDVVDGIRGKISVGYYVMDMMEISEKDADMPVFRVTKWVPIEASSVPIPADDTVGIGRKLEDKVKAVEIEPVKELESPKTEDVSQTIGSKTEKLIITEVKKMTTESNVANIEVGKDYNKEVNEILEIAKRFDKFEMAKEYISAKKSVGEFQRAVLDAFDNDPAAFIKPDKKQPDEIGMSEKEISQWSLMNYVRDWEKQHNGKGAIKSFEKDVSEEIAKKLGREAKGIYMPLDVQKKKAVYNKEQRAMTIGSATAGGNLVETQLLSDMFVDVLRNTDVTSQLGFTVINGLRGLYNIPRRTSSATIAWVAENGSAAESTGLYDTISMSAKSVTGNSVLSREQRLQSSVDAEAFALYDLITSLNLDKASKIFNGTGTNNQITGLLTQSGINSISPSANGDAPTWALMNQMKKEIRIDNVQGVIKLIINAATEYALAITPKVTAMDHYLLDDQTGRCAGMETFVTNMLPSNITKGGSGATLSKAISLVPENVIVGYWGGLDILIDPYTYSNDFRIRLNAIQDMDLALKHAEAVCVFADIITA